MDQILLDIHCHLVPLTPERTEGLPGVAWTPEGTLTVDGYTLASPSVYRVESLLAWMDENRVERAWISVPPPLYRLELEAGPAGAWTTACNEALQAVAAGYPDRLTPLFHLPLQHPALAAEVAGVWAGRAKPLFAMPAGSANGGVKLSDPAYAPLWQALDAASAFLFLHPSKGCDPRYDAFYLQNLLGSPVETALAAAHLALSGIIERHSRMTLCLAHGGGATAAVAGRLERGQLTGRPGAATGADRPRRVLKTVCVDCICHDPAALELSAAIHGKDKVLFGSDWPFSMGLPEPHQALAETRAELRAKIFRDNPRRLLAKYGIAGGG